MLQFTRDRTAAGGAGLASSGAAMRAALIIFGWVFGGCVAVTPTMQTVNRSMLAGLPPMPAAQVAPEGWMSVWAGTQTAPVANPTSSGVQLPAAQPEAGTLFLTAQRHLLLGASVYGASSDWGRKTNASQPKIDNGILFGARVRVGFQFNLPDPRFGAIASIEPGFDVVPWASDLTRSREGAVFMPAISGSLTPFFESGRLRVFVGVSAATMPQLTLTKTVVSGCAACATPGGEYDSYVSATAGVKVNITQSFALTAAVTVPFTRTEPEMLPMLSVGLMALQNRDVPVEEPEPEPEDPEESAPPLIEAPPVEEPAQL